jgi:hypothetical protein
LDFDKPEHFSIITELIKEKLCLNR